MQPIYLFDLASRRTAWLAARETAIAGNVANANTPGYHAKDVAPFQDVLARTQLDLASTNAQHIPVSGGDQFGVSETNETDAGLDVTETGNTVGMEQEMVKAGDVNRDYSLTTNVMKSFHSMLMASLKSG